MFDFHRLHEIPVPETGINQQNTMCVEGATLIKNTSPWSSNVQLLEGIVPLETNTTVMHRN